MASSIGRKIVFTFIIVLILMGAIVSITYKGYQEIIQSLNLIENESSKRGAAGNLRFSISKLIMYTNDYIITEDTEYRNLFQKQYSSVLEYYKKIYDYNLDNDEKIILEKIFSDLDSVTLYSNQIFEIQNPKTSPQAASLMIRMDYEHAECLYNRTTELFDHISKKIEDLKAESKDDKSSALNTIYIVTGLGFIVSCLVSYLAVKRITKPIITITKAANKIANGDYSVRPDVKTHDEIKVLAESFNKMAESIQTSHEKLNLSKIYNQNIVETVPSALIIFNNEFNILSANKSFYKIFKLTEKVEYKKLEEVLSLIEIHQNCRELVHDLIPFKDHECRCSMGCSTTLKNYDPDRTLLISLEELISMNENKKHYLLVIDDITEIKRKDKEIRDTKEQLENIFNNLEEVIFWSVDIVNHKLLQLSPGVEKIYGRKREEFFLKPNLWSQVLFNNEPPVNLASLYKYIGKTYSSTVQITRPDGEIRWTENFLRPITNDKGTIIRIDGFARDITEKYRADELLRRSEEKYRELVENIPLVIYSLAGDEGIIESLNPAFEKITGWSAEEWLGKSFIPLVHPEDTERAIDTYTKSMNGESVDIYELRILAKNGDYITGEFTSTPYYKEGKPIGEFGIARDITERKKILLQLNLFNELSLMIAGADDFTSALSLTLEKICLTAGWDYAEAWIPDANEEYLVFSDAYYHRTEKHKEFLNGSTKYKFKKGQGLPGIVWETKIPYWMCDVTRETNFPRAKLASSVGFFTGIGIPVLAKGKVIVALSIFTHLKREIIDKALLDMLSALASQLGTLFQKKRADSLIQQNEERYRVLFETARDAIYQLSLDGKFVSINKAFEVGTGWKVKDWIGKDFLGLIHPDDVDLAVQNYQDVRKGKRPLPYEIRVLKKDGSYLTTEIAPTPLIIDGEIKGSIGVARDITERKIAEEKIRKSEELLKKVLQTLPVGVWITDNNGVIQYGNPEGQKIWSGAKYIGVEQYGEYKGWWADTGKKIAADEWALARAVQKGETSINEVIDIECFDGTRKTILNSAIPMTDKGEITGAIVVNEDITEKRLAEKKVIDSERRLKEAEQIANLGNWEWDVIQNNVIWSDEIYRIFGLKPQEFNATYEAFLESVHKDDRDFVNTAVTNALKYNKPYDIEHRISLPDDTVKFVHERANVVFDELHNPVRMLGTTQDITERKRNEDALRKLSLAVEQASVSILITDIHGNIEYANPKFTDVTGYKLDEIINQNPRILQSGKTSTDEYKKLWSTILSGKVWKGEFENKRKNGEHFWDSVAISPIKNDKGDITHLLGIHEDVTEKRLKDELIQKSLKEKEVMLREIHHRVKNNLQVVASLLKMQASTIKDPVSAEYFEISQHRIRSMALVHQQLYRSSDFSSVDFGEYLVNLIEQLKNSYGIDDLKIKVNVEAKDIYLDLETAIPTGLLINELLSNTFKHAFIESKSGKVEVEIKRKGENEFLIRVADNGKGIDKNMDIYNTTSLGMQLIVTLTEQLNGKIVLNRDKGTEFIITISPYIYPKRI